MKAPPLGAGCAFIREKGVPLARQGFPSHSAKEPTVPTALICFLDAVPVLKDGAFTFRRTAAECKWARELFRARDLFREYLTISYWALPPNRRVSAWLARNMALARGLCRYGLIIQTTPPPEPPNSAVP